MPNGPLFLGIDVGTGGVRALAVTADGQVAARASVPFDAAVLASQDGRHEQPPEAWWQAVCRATSTLCRDLDAAGTPSGQLTAVSVDGTSGTIVPLDASGKPLRPALMYNDPRAATEAEQINRFAEEFCRKLGYRFKSSFALAKILWLANNEPDLFDNTARFVHQADYVLGRLAGRAVATDYSNTLKTGYDLLEERWPAWIDQLSPLADRLPRVVAPGTEIARLSAAAARQTGLREGLPIVSGATDGTAAFLASGAARPGDYNTTLGTTLVFKGISERICRHGEGLIYCHKLPGGRWLPGAASNTGAQWISSFFADADPSAMDAAAQSRLPSDCLAYPLVRNGERFPFLSDRAEGFFVPQPAGDLERYAACLQGTALLERLAYEVLERAAGTSGGRVFSTGGGSRSDVWMQCRADVTGRVLQRPACGESAFGAAVLAAAGTFYADLQEAVGQMVCIERSFTPDGKHAARYQQLFERFCDELRVRSYL